MDPRQPPAPDPWPQATRARPSAPRPVSPPPGAAEPVASVAAAAPRAHARAPAPAAGATSGAPVGPGCDPAVSDRPATAPALAPVASAEDGPLAEGGPLAEDGPLAAGGPLVEDGPVAEGGPLAEDGPLAEGAPVATPGPAGLSEFVRRPTRGADDEPALAAAVARARRGDPHAFDTIAAILAPPLTRYATVILGGDGAAADDVVQDALVAGWLALPTLRAPHRLRGWMFSVTHRKAMSWLRYRGIRRSDPLIDDADADDGPHAPAPPPPRSAEDEARADLYRALGSIPVRYVGPLTLCYLEGLGLRETARVLALAPNTLKMRLHRGRALLRRRLTRLEGWRLHRRRDAASGRAPADPPGPPLPRPPEDAPRRSPA